MLGFVKKLFRRRAAVPTPTDYGLQKKRLTSGDPSQHKLLAQDDATHPEILYFLAENSTTDVRNAVAANPSTPAQAALLLARDPDVDVRLALAARLLALLPEISPEKQSQLYAYAVQVLGMMAQDEVLQVRRALSTVLRDYAKAPPAVVSRLARDVEREISEPILRFCIALPDEELLDILGGHPEPWVIGAIASRPIVSPPVSEAVIDTGDDDAAKTLLENAGAAFLPETLQKVVDRARSRPEWHFALAARRELTLEHARALAGFVDEKVMSALGKRSDFDAATLQGIGALVGRRLAFMRRSGPQEGAEEKVARYLSENALTSEVLQDALAWQEIDFVTLALANLSRVHVIVVRKILESASPKAVVALCWKAGLPMRAAIEVQRLAAKIPPKDILYARGGTDYPLDDGEMNWQLEFFGVGEAG